MRYREARFYQPRHGRFTQVDPVYAGLFDPQQWNRYTYARANPLSFVDPDGRQVQPTEVYRSDAIFWTQNNPVPPPPPPSLTIGVSYPGSASVAYSGPFGGLFAGDLGNVYQEDAGLGAAGGSAGWLETIRDVADVISVVDPTPVSNLVSAGASLGMGEVGTAAITVAGAVPVFGAPIDAARAATAVSRLFVSAGRHVVPVPAGWTTRVAANGAGVVFQRPGAMGNAHMIRIMDPTGRYPDGYVRITNAAGAYVDASGRVVSRRDPAGHIPLSYVGSVSWPW